MPRTIAAARALSAGLMILVPSLANAEYGPKTVFGTNYQQTSTTKSTDGINEGNCNSLAHCYILFQRPPEQKNLIVQHVSCQVNVTAGGIESGLLIARKGQTFPLKRTLLAPIRTTGTFWAANSPVMHLVGSNEAPVVVFYGSAFATWLPTCNISGQLTQL
jgi:hypothetical protein